MDSKSVSEILKIADRIERQGYHRELADSYIIGRMLYNPSYLEEQIVDLAAARLGFTSVDLSWANFDSRETSTLFDELQMTSEAVDLLITAIRSNETFGEGRSITTKIPEYSKVPIISLHDDIYHWQSALSHLHGIKKQLGSLSGEKIAISWVYGSTFNSPALIHALLLGGAFSGASISVIAPPDFPVLGRVRREALEEIRGSDTEIEFSHDFVNAFKDARAIVPLNWLRLDNFNHPERNQEYARKYKDWFLREDLISEDCLISTEPTIQSELSISSDLLHSERTISSSWLSNRVTILAATIEYVLDKKDMEYDISLV